MKSIKTYITRGNFIESIHDTKCLIKDFNYKTIFSTGHDNDFIYPRSSIKIFQAVPFIKSQAHKEFKLSNKQIAISCSSHHGEKQHLIILNNWIKKLNISKKILKCGIHNPLDQTSSNNLLLKGNKPNQLHNNCAGKHLGMITGCLLYKMSIKNYVSINHPYQKLIRQSLEYFTGFKITKKQFSIDGCSAPQYAFPLKNLCVSMINLLKNYNGNNQFSQEVKILLNSICMYPELKSGSKKYDSQLMKITKGKIFSKLGAEGVLLFAHKNKKIGGAIKIKDGNQRALPSVANQIFKRLSLISKEEERKLFNWTTQYLYNHANIKVGEIYSKINN